MYQVAILATDRQHQFGYSSPTVIKLVSGKQWPREANKMNFVSQPTAEVFASSEDAKKWLQDNGHDVKFCRFI